MTMDFKEWMEGRFKGLQRMFNTQHADMPRYVRKDMYDNRIGYSMGAFVKDSSSGSGGSGSDHPYSSASKIFDSAKLKNIQWTKRPEILTRYGKNGVTPSDFNEITQRRFIGRLFGFREINVRNDAERMQIQNRLMQQRSGNNEPVIVLHTKEGYQLLEGWHRTMNYLLQGCPKDQLEALQNGNTSNLDFSKWSPIQIQGYIGRGPEMIKALAGTGDFNP